MKSEQDFETRTEYVDYVHTYLIALAMNGLTSFHGSFTLGSKEIALTAKKIADETIKVMGI